MLEGYITPLLMSYIDKYVKNIKPSDLKLSFWGGDAVLTNLELRLDVLERELHIPLEFKSGFIRQLTLHLPWNAIASSSVEVIIKDLEFVILLKSLRTAATDAQASDKNSSSPDSTTVQSEAVSTNQEEQTPGYLQGYLNRIMNNVQVTIQNMVVKVIEEESDMMMTFNFGSINFYTANENWGREYIFTDYFQDDYSLYKVCEVDNITVNLHPIELKEKAQGSLLHEPFVNRCSFTYRVKYEYHDKVLVRKISEIMIDALELSVDEKQFCLYLHFLDWFLAMYYSSKKLKGRDHNPYLVKELQINQEAHESSDEIHSSNSPPNSPKVGSSTGMSPEGIGSGNETGSGQTGEALQRQGSLGWGSWMWSFVAESETEDSKEEHRYTKEDDTTLKEFKQMQSRFGITANSVTVTLKMTQQVKVPVFFSTRSFTSPVLKVSFIGCVFSMDKCPLTKQFLVSIGVASVKAYILGLCPCVKKFPSSWRRTSVTSTTEASEMVQVFSLGLETTDYHSNNESNATNTGSNVPEMEIKDELLVKYSLFAKNPTRFPPRLDDSFLKEVGEPFRAVWFTYDYYDIGSERSVEVCTASLDVGKVSVVLSPDLLHRVELFYTSFQTSLEATPSFTKGMVVIGDPKAVTHYRINLSEINIILTSCSHYLPTVSDVGSRTLRSHHTPKQLTKKPQQPFSPSLPCLCVKNAGVRLDITSPMYSRNSLPDLPQRLSICTIVGEVKTRMSEVRSLCEGMDLITNPTIDNSDIFNHFFKLPAVNFTYSAVMHEDLSSDDVCLSKDTSYLQIDIEKVSSTLSLHHISQLLFIANSWKTSTSPLSSSQSQEPLPPLLPEFPRIGHLHLSLQDFKLTLSTSSHFQCLSTVLGSGCVAILKELDEGSPGGYLPILYGPFDTSRWSHSKGNVVDSDDEYTEKLVEVLMTFPHDSIKDKVFPTVQLNLSGFGLSLEPLILQFFNYFPHHVINGSQSSFHGSTNPHVGAGEMGGKLQQEHDPVTPVSSLPYTLTPTPSVVEQNCEQPPVENELLTILKIYALKVETRSILVFFPTSETQPLSSPEFNHKLMRKFPILTQLAPPSPLTNSSSSCSISSCLIVSLPCILLESAKSHVLDEPVPRHSRVDTLPWDCSLSDMAVFTNINHKIHSVLDPLVVKTTLASQQEGIGVTVHSDTVALSLSKKQVHLLCYVVSAISEKVSAFTSPSSSTINGEDSGISSSRTPLGLDPATPSPTNATPSTHPTVSEISTSSSNFYQGLSFLWLQVLISKFVLNIYGRDNQQKQEVRQEIKVKTGQKVGDATFIDPVTSTSTRSQINVCDSLDKSLPQPVRLSLEVENMSMQIDVQERCTDFVFKISSIECDMCSFMDNFPFPGQWVPHLGESNGKLFSSTTSNFPDDVLQLIATASGFSSVRQPRTPGNTSDFMSSMTQNQNQFQSSFVYLKGSLPRKYQLMKRLKVDVNVQPFEVVVWLPVFDLFRSVLVSEGKSAEDPPPPQKPAKTAPDLSMWPSMELNLDCFRVIFPSQDFSHTLLLTTEGVSVTSSIDFAGPEVRFVTNPSAYQNLSLLSSEKKQLPLPAYQLDLYSMTVWGVAGSGASVRAFVYSSNADLQIVYTPPLYSQVVRPHPLHSKLILASGHNIEANFTNDFCLFLGQDQVSNITKILKKNRLECKPKDTGLKDSIEDTKVLKVTEEDYNIPLKVLVTGKMVVLCLLTPPSVDNLTLDKGLCSVQYGQAVPLLVASLYNPLCALQLLEDGRSEAEMSLFNMSVSSHQEKISIAYSDLMEIQNWPSPTSQVLETRKGTAKDNKTFPPNILSLKWSVAATGPTSNMHAETGSNVTCVTRVKIGRPCKVSGNSFLLKECLNAVMSLSVEPPVVEPSKVSIDEGLSSAEKNSKEEEPECSVSNNIVAEKENDSSVAGIEKDYSEESHQNALFQEMELHLSSDQVLFEFLLCGVEATDMPNSSFMITEDIQTFSSFSKEGVLMSWDKLTLSIPCKDSREPSAALSFNGLQLVSIKDRLTEYIVLPANLEVLMTQHLPCSALDMAQLNFSVSLNFMNIYLNQRSVQLMHRIVQSVSESLTTGLKSHPHSERVMKDSGKELYLKDLTQQFEDDLGILDFKYVVDESECPRLPLAGEILFHSGGSVMVPTMTWQYWEPRAVSKVHLLPIPLTITNEEDAPVISSSIRVGCKLEFWNESTSSFDNLTSFYLSESSEYDLSIPNSVQAVSRTWRVSMTHLEWFDDDTEELESIPCNEKVGSNGQQYPSSTILSPLSLGGSMKVNSIFSPDFLPSLTLTLLCKTFQVTLFHSSDFAKENSGMFDCYRIISGDAISMTSMPPPPQELLKLHTTNAGAQLRMMRQSSVEITLDGVCSLEFVDYSDLVWRVALSPTHVTLLVTFDNGRNEISHFDGPLPVLSLQLKVNSSIIKLSQGMLHTISMTFYLWKDTLDSLLAREKEVSKHACAEIIPNYYVICNDTCEDLKIGQVDSTEELFLPSASCMGYSWTHTTAAKKLRLAIAGVNPLQWTTPFSIDATGVTSISIPIKTSIAAAYVKVVNTEGLQLQVVIYGSWTFFSTLTYPLDVALTAGDSFSDCEKNSSVSPVSRKIFTIHPNQNLPSVLAPNGELVGVVLRSPTSQWSKLYPLPEGEGWNKPQFLVELSESSGKETQFWFSVKPMSMATAKRSWGHRVTFSSLFAVCNHLSFDLNMIVSQSQENMQASVDCSSDSGTSIIPGNGETKTLQPLYAEKWYFLRFSMSDTSAVSEPPVSISTFLLHHLAFSSDQSAPNLVTLHISLPVDSNSDRSYKIHATFLRNNTNTITVNLWPENTIFNETPLALSLVEPTLGEEKEEKERVVELGPYVTKLLCQNEFVLRTVSREDLLVSNLVTIPSLPSSTGVKTVQPASEILPSVKISLVPVLAGLEKLSNSANQSIMAKAIVSFQRQASSITTTVKSSFVLQNSTPYRIRAIPCITEKGNFSNQRLPMFYHHTLMEELEPGQTQALLFWNLIGCSHTSKEITHSLLLTGLEVDTCISSSWSVYLSTNFVRHCFSLPIGKPSQYYAACLLTMHEYGDTIYLVLREDSCPRVCIQNLTSFDLEVVECNRTGISACPQMIPACHEIVYEPPSLAKLYPIVYDEDIATKLDKRVQQAAKNVQIKLRCFQSDVQENKRPNDEEGWSNSLPVCHDRDKILMIPKYGEVMVSTDIKMNNIFISILPTGGLPTQPLSSSLGLTAEQNFSKIFKCEINISEFILSLCDDTRQTERTTEILRFIISKMHFFHTSFGPDGAEVSLTLQSLRIDNMINQSCGDFAVAFIPRSEHAARRQLIQQEVQPLLHFFIHYNPHTSLQIYSIYLCTQPVTFQLEDSLYQRLKNVIRTYKPPRMPLPRDIESMSLSSNNATIPSPVLQESERDAYPVTISRLVIESVTIYVSANITLKVYLSCSDSPFWFSRYELKDVYSNWSEISQVVAARYLSALYMHIGWIVGSLELIGSPATFIQSVGRGLRDLVSLPYEGLTRSPGLFIMGIGQGTASFVRQVSSGALSSVTNLASSIAKNMERLSMDKDHMMYQDLQRREWPAVHFTTGITSGVSSFGLSLMSAVAGLVEQPMQSVQQMDESSGTATTFLKGVGKGLLGVVTKPVGGAMDLVSKTGQGIMHGTGLAQKLEHYKVLEEMVEFIRIPVQGDLLLTNASYLRKLQKGPIIISCLATLLSETGSQTASCLLLSPDHLYIWDTVTDSLSHTLQVQDYLITQGLPQEGNEIQFHITVCSIPGQESVPAGDYEKVEQYLQLSEVDFQPEPVLMDVTEFKTVSGSAEKEGGVVLWLDSSHGSQFLTVYNSLRYNLNDVTVYCIHHHN